jgi:polygalacturonase
MLYALVVSLLVSWIVFFPDSANAVTTATIQNSWDQVSQILSNIKSPTFPNQNFNITDYGAVGDGTTDCTDAFKQAIDAANQAGGGVVVVPAGTYLTGAITLKSNVNLYVSNGATIKFSQDPSKYPLVLTQDGGIEIYNYSPFIYAYGAENIAITGSGILDGQADNTHWWPWKNLAGSDGELENYYSDNNVPVEQRIFGNGHYIRPVFIQPYKSKNILIQGVTILNSPNWQINPVLCDNVTVEDVKICGGGPNKFGNNDGPNTDGVDPEQTQNMLIENNYFLCGDDDIAIKSGKNADGRRINVPSKNIIIRNNYFSDGHGGITIGSEESGGVNNIYAENNIFDSPNLDYAFRFKTNSVRGGTIENIYYRNNTIKNLSNKGGVLYFDLNYGEGDTGPFTPIVRNIVLDNITSNGGKYGIYTSMYDRAPLTGLQITNSTFNNVGISMVLQNVLDPIFLNFTVNGTTYNSIPIITTATVTPSQPDGLNGWYTHAASVILSAVDSLSKDFQTLYSLDGITWNTYTDPIMFQTDGQYKLKYRTIDRDSKGNIQNKEAIQILNLNIDTLAPTIDIISPEPDCIFGDSLDLTPQFTVTDNLSGVDQNKTVIRIDGQIQSDPSIPLYVLPLGKHTLTITASDMAGNLNTKTILFQTTTSINDLKILVTYFTDNGWIDNNGISNSLLKKLDHEGLNEFINEVQAQKDKHISVNAANILLRDAKFLLNN